MTVVFCDIGAAANVGGSLYYRTVDVPLTEEQERLLTTRNQWESIDRIIVEERDR